MYQFISNIKKHLTIFHLFSLVIMPLFGDATIEPVDQEEIKRIENVVETSIRNNSLEEGGGFVEFKCDSSQERKKDIFFKIVATYSCSSANKDCEKKLKKWLELRNDWSVCDGNLCKEAHSHSYKHPFQAAGTRPYENGDGGLLNPVLKEYSVESKKIVDDSCEAVRVTISGRVAADGIASYEFDNTQYGKGYHGPYTAYDAFTKKEYTAIPDWEPSILEQAILGALKERAADRQLSDLTDTYFPDGNCFFSELFKECVKKEWTSKVDENDSGQRSAECVDLIKKHFPRSVYWSSKGRNELRAGEIERSYFGRVQSVELSEFEITVE